MKTTSQCRFSTDETWFLLDQMGQRYKLEAFTFDFECRTERLSVKPEKFSYNEAQIATITKELSNLKVMITIAESRENEPTLGVFLEAKGSDGKKHKRKLLQPPFLTPKKVFI